MDRNSVRTAAEALTEGLLACPACGGVLIEEGKTLLCSACGVRHPYTEAKAFFTDVPTDTNAPTRGRTPDSWSRWRKENFTFFESELKDTPDSARIVDLGAGPTQFMSLFTRFASYLGVDFLPYDDVAIVARLDERLPLADGSAEVVILSNTLEHMPDARPLLAESLRILTPGGKVLITTPFLMRIHQAPYDFNRYTRYQLESLLQGAGFTEIAVRSLGSPALAYDTLERQFFGMLTNAKPFPDPFRNLWFRFAAWKMRILSRGLTKLAGWFYRLLPPDERYTEGYGSVGKRG